MDMSNKVAMAKNSTYNYLKIIFRKTSSLEETFFEKCHVFLIKLCQNLGDDEKLAFLI